MREREAAIGTLARADLGAERSTRRLVDRLRQEPDFLDPATGQLRRTWQRFVVWSLLGSRPVTGVALLASLLEAPPAERYGRAIARRAAQRLGIPSQLLDQGRSYSARVGDVLDILVDVGLARRSVAPRGKAEIGQPRTIELAPGAAELLEGLLHLADLDEAVGAAGGTGAVHRFRGSGPPEFVSRTAVGELLRYALERPRALDLPAALDILEHAEEARRTAGSGADRAYVQAEMEALGLLPGDEATGPSDPLGRPSRAGISEARLSTELAGLLAKGPVAFRIPEADAQRLVAEVLPAARAAPAALLRSGALRELLRSELRREYLDPFGDPRTALRALAAEARAECRAARLFLEVGERDRSAARADVAVERTIQAILGGLGHLPPRRPDRARATLQAVLEDHAALVRAHPGMPPVDRTRFAQVVRALQPNGSAGRGRREIEEATARCEAALLSLERTEPPRAARRRARPSRPSAEGPRDRAERALAEARELGWDRDFDATARAIERGLAELRELRGPSRREWRSLTLLGSLLRERAALEVQHGNATAATASLAEAERVLRAAVRAAPTEPAPLREVAAIHSRRGDLALHADAPEEAVRRFRQAIARASAAERLGPGGWASERNLALYHRSLGEAFLLQGDAAEALPWLTESERRIAPLLRRAETEGDEVRAANCHMNLAIARVHATRALEASGEAERAETVAESAVTAAGRAVRVSAGRNPVILRWEATALRSLAELRLRRRQGRRARGPIQGARRSLRASLALEPWEPAALLEATRLGVIVGPTGSSGPAPGLRSEAHGRSPATIVARRNPAPTAGRYQAA